MRGFKKKNAYRFLGLCLKSPFLCYFANSEAKADTDKNARKMAEPALEIVPYVKILTLKIDARCMPDGTADT